ncbi:MAG: hypothetical protein Q4E50_05310 [Tissierellia bacterium]|nr:hypothetical protein [Tissierellia bacterium]
MNPYLANKRARAVIISYKADERLINLIESLGIEIIFTQKAKVDPRIDDHADIQVHPVSYDKFIVAPRLFDYYKEKLQVYGIEVIKGSTFLEEKYPKDCPYNLARLNNFYISKKGVADRLLEKILEDQGLKAIYQKQAYAKCSTIGFEDFAITCDKSILKALRDRDIEAYYINNENIKLEGFNIGFLGGSCGIIDNKKILFTGDISLLKDFNILKKILHEKEIEIIFPKDASLTDIGSIIPII